MGCGSQCELDAAQSDVAGTNATSCGRVALVGDRTASRRCAIEALRAGRAFRVEWQTLGIDSEVWSGLARAPDGTGYSFLWDGGQSFVSNGARTHRTRCARLEVATVDGEEDVVCQLGGPLEPVCGR